MKLGSLRAIDAFVRLGGTGEAAQGLGMSQSAVIKTLRQAEEALDLSLATTIQGRLVPTPEAQSLVRQAQPLFNVLRRARHEADMIRVGMADRLRVATVPGLAHSILPPAITRTRRDLDAGAAVEIMFDHVREHLGAGEADLGISYGPMKAEDIEDIALGQSPLICVLARGHPRAASQGQIGPTAGAGAQIDASLARGNAPTETKFDLGQLGEGSRRGCSIGRNFNDSAGKAR